MDRTWTVTTINQLADSRRVEGRSNPGNFGFPASINQGLRLARGEYLV